MSKVYVSGRKALEDQRRLEATFKKRVLVPAQVISANKVMRKAVKRSPTDRGHYRNAWRVKRSMKPVSQGQVELVNDAPYAGVLEQGARPFHAPIGPLIEWAQRKAGALALGGKIRIGPQAFKTNKAGNLVFKGKASLDEYDQDEVERFAYAVKRKIAREGLPALWIMRRLLPYARKELKKATESQIRKAGDLSGRGPGGR